MEAINENGALLTVEEALGRPGITIRCMTSVPEDLESLLEEFNAQEEENLG